MAASAERTPAREETPTRTSNANSDNIRTEAHRVLDLVDKGQYTKAAEALRTDSRMAPDQAREFYQALRSEAANGKHVHPLSISGLDEGGNGNIRIAVGGHGHGRERTLYEGKAPAKTEGAPADPHARAESAVEGSSRTLPMQKGEGYFQYVKRIHPDMDDKSAVAEARRLKELNKGKDILSVGERVDTLKADDKSALVKEQEKKIQESDRKERADKTIADFRTNPAEKQVPRFGDLLGLTKEQGDKIAAEQKKAENKGVLFGDMAVKMGMVSPEEKTRAESVMHDLRGEKAQAEFKKDPAKNTPPDVFKLMGLTDPEIKAVREGAGSDTSRKKIADVVAEKGLRTPEQVQKAFEQYSANIKERGDAQLRKASTPGSEYPPESREAVTKERMEKANLRTENERTERQNGVLRDFMTAPDKNQLPGNLLFGLKQNELATVALAQGMGDKRSFGDIASSMGFISPEQAKKVQELITYTEEVRKRVSPNPPT